MRPGKPRIRRAVAWLEAHQNPDGGWGEDLRSYDDPAWAGRGASTASQTAWALLALLAAGDGDGAAVERGIRWLAQTQRPDGTWDEPQFTGTGFPGDFYINYHLYRLVFPVSALGRYLGEAAGGVAGPGVPAGTSGGRREPACLSARRCGSRPARCGAESPGGGDVRRTGYGPQIRGGRRLRTASFGMLAISGTGGGLSADLQPGDLVVGTEVTGGAASISCPSAPLLAGELRRAGLRAVAGPVVSTPRLVRGAGRTGWRPAARWPRTWNRPGC